VTGIYIGAGLPPAKFPYKLNFDHDALCAALAAGEIATTNQKKIVVFDAGLAAIQKRPAAERHMGSYKPGRRGVAPETRFGLDLYDVYRNLGGPLSIRSRGFYGLALRCAQLVGIEIGSAENFEAKMRRATKP
jgi:hypothetical protein